MRVRGSINYNNTLIEITEQNLRELLFKHDEEGTKIMVTILIEEKELTFGEDAIHELKLVQVSDPINQDLGAVEEMIKSATNS